MFLAVINGNTDIMRRVTSHNAFFHHGTDAFFDRSHVIARDRASKNVIAKREFFSFDGEDLQVHFTKLTGTAGLLFVTIHRAGFFCDVLFVRHFGFVQIQVQLEFLLSPLDCHIDVLISHSKHQRLAGCGFHFPRKGHIFFNQPVQSLAHLGSVRLGPWGDGDAIKRIGIIRNGQGQVLLFCGQRVASCRHCKFRHRSNITTVNNRHRVHILAKWHLHTCQAFFLALIGVPYTCVRIHRAGIDPEKGLTPDEWVCCGLPNIGCKRSSIIEI